ncbi:hypothetical protein [Flavobacterium sp. 7A]|uniref:hypothetical protein n=1 Tax=Flavobacterium sp. 7A TaxID=2940571 RepID=UPI002227114A|nr:hypothetical protein [Flavobacterium sp. 7A]MCW2117915.1 hypothetical protein [Flavobacterium sp. 7A]
MKRLLLLFGIVLVALTIASNTKNEDKKNTKIIVCHKIPSNPAKISNIEININDLQTHLDHGDYVISNTISAK